MFRVKRLYTFMLQSFLPLFIMTFFICLFVVLMQFLWRFVDEIVGKGLSIDIIGELFFYAALTMVPTALPLAVLLASLMTFGNLGEKFELTALKASGISLFKIMRPLIILMACIAVGAFFFQNNVLPVAQAKMYTLLFSVKQKTPEVEIPEKSFYDQIPNINLYIDHKNPETGMLYGMILYDITRGMDNSRVILADSGSISFTEDKKHLFLQLYSGEMFENLRENTMGVTASGYMPFRREQFDDKQIYMAFDANFNRLDEGGMRSQFVGQNISQLRHSIDSIGARVDSIGSVYAAEILSIPVMGVTLTTSEIRGDTTVTVSRPTVAMETPLDLDSIFNSPSPSYAKTYLNQALSKARRQKLDYEYRSLALSEEAKIMRRHDIEMQKKFTLSFACIIFFFIGAPLGAIIKKGGLGTPLVISVLLFIVYFIIDNSGFKMARDGKLEVYQGMWLSSFVLLPLGIFFTYKAVGDSAVFNVDAYRNFINRLIGREAKRNLEVKEVVMTEVQPDIALARLADFETQCDKEAMRLKNSSFIMKRFNTSGLHLLKNNLNDIVDYLSNSHDRVVVNLLNNYPFNITSRNLASVIDNTRALAARISREAGIDEENEK
ncbi:MAG: LptF/LptG family permease [Muribaculaceae bacterium]|nr:LptF/LptG family permease [Muribaculaceae bacterium]MDE6703222.1 LptF/LptG family permease [Muribaculaceae bacterium]